MNGEYSTYINQHFEIYHGNNTYKLKDNAGAYTCDANALLSHDTDRVKLITAESKTIILLMLINHIA